MDPLIQALLISGGVLAALSLVAGIVAVHRRRVATPSTTTLLLSTPGVSFWLLAVVAFVLHGSGVIQLTDLDATAQSRAATLACLLLLALCGASSVLVAWLTNLNRAHAAVSSLVNVSSMVSIGMLLL